MIEFDWLWAFALLPAPLLVRWLLPAREREQAPLGVPDIEPFAFPVPRRIGAHAGRRWPLWLLLATWLALVLAAARPQFTGDPVSLPTSGRDLMLAVDLSGSMSAEDMRISNQQVDRLTVVKAVIREFIARRDGDRVGLILFGSNAYLQAPLTFDLASVSTLLDEAPVGIAGGKTAIGDAIGLAVKRLRERPEGDRVLVLLTDGANNVGSVSPVKAAELANAAGVRIHTVGVGAERLVKPSLLGLGGPRVVNPSADLDEESLTRIAAVTGGRYFRARDTAELVGIYALIDELEPVEQAAEVFRPRRQLFHYPLAFALGALALLLALLTAESVGDARQRPTDEAPHA
ncbi:MAG: VWA domain-containing protein [Pseudomonadota bacterium]